MSLLFFSGSPPHYMAPPLLAGCQINFGPYFSTEEHQGVFSSMRTGVGEYDVVPLLRVLPLEQAPSAIVCLVDSSRQSVPRNIAALPCPKVLLVADTHHLARPLRHIIDYARAERFDRVVLLYDRHHADLFRRAGVKNLFWFPGLTFPHPDEVVRRAAAEVRLPRLAMVGQAGAFHPRRLRLAGALARAGLPLELESFGQAEALKFYGQSLIAFNASLNGDLNLRCFEALAAGAALLTDRLSEEAGLGDLWEEGREATTYADEAELLERAKHLLEHPTEARARGAAGAAWFLKHFNAERRRSAFTRLVFDGTHVPGFSLPNPKRTTVACGAEALAVYEETQCVHLTEERVRVLLGADVPRDFDDIFGTLPRVEIVRDDQIPAAKMADLGVSGCGAISAAMATARRLWIHNAAGPQRAEVKRIFAEGGFRTPLPDVCYFVRSDLPGREDAIPPEIQKGRGLLAAGDVSGALAAATEAIAKYPAIPDGCLLVAELAAEARQPELRAQMLERAARIAPDDPRVWLARLPGAGEPRLARRLVASAWRALDERDQHRVCRFAVSALEKMPDLPDARYLAGRADLIAVRSANYWMPYAVGLRRLGEAARLAPDRPELWRAWGWELLRSGGLAEESIPAFRAALALESADAGDWRGLGDALMWAGRHAEAEEAFGQGLRRAPGDLLLRRRLGHALKQQGRIDEAHAAYRLSFGGKGRPATQRRGRPRVVFIAQNGHSWPCQHSIYEAFAADPDWETIVVALPWSHPSMMHSTRKDEPNKIFQFLRDQGIPYVHWEEFPVAEETADLLFVQNPYDSTRPEGWRVPELVRAGHRLCYVPYAIEFGGTIEDQNYQFNLMLQQHAWAVIARSEEHRALFRRHCASGDAHVLVCGHPKFDSLAREAAIVPDPAVRTMAGGRPVVLWTPHFDVRLNGTRFGDGYSSFLRWRDFLTQEFARRQDLAFVIRPHPTFFAALEHRGFMNRRELDEWTARCEAAGNVMMNTSSEYYSILAASDILLSDASSLIIEFGITGKPVGYLHNPNGPLAHIDYEIDFDYIRQHCTWVTEEAEAKAFLDRAAAGELTVWAERRADLCRRMGICPEGVGNRVKRGLEERLGRIVSAPTAVTA